MPIVATDPERFIGKVVGTGHCVPFVQHVSRVGPTHTWRAGRRARGGNLLRHTVIATFIGGRYTNSRDGSSHAAVLLAEQRDGLQVLDQWLGRPVGQRLIRFRNGQGTANNDGDRFFAVEVS